MDDDLPSYDAVVSGVDAGGGFNAAIPGDPEVGWSLEATESRKNAGKTEKQKAQDSKEVGRPPTVLERRPVVRDGGGRGAQRQPGMFSISAFHERMTRSDDTYGSADAYAGIILIMACLFCICCTALILPVIGAILVEKTDDSYYLEADSDGYDANGNYVGAPCDAEVPALVIASFLCAFLICCLSVCALNFQANAIGAVLTIFICLGLVVAIAVLNIFVRSNGLNTQNGAAGANCRNSMVENTAQAMANLIAIILFPGAPFIVIAIYCCGCACWSIKKQQPFCTTLNHLCDE